MKEIELEYVTIRYEEPVIHLVFKQGAELGYFEIISLTSFSQTLSGNKPYVVLSDVRAGDISVTPEGKKLASDGTKHPYCKGSAVVVSSTLMEMAANFFNHVSQPPQPYRAFTEKKKAMEWLLKLPLAVVIQLAVL